MTPIVFIHGFLGSAKDWREVMNDLPSSLAIDIPITTAWSETVEALANQIPPNAIICGYSMGARLALGCILSHPHRFQGLVFVSGNPGINDADRHARLHHDRQVAKQLKSTCPEMFLKPWYKQSVFSGIDPHRLTRLINSKKVLDTDRHAHLLAVNSVAQQPNYWPQLPQMETPCLIIAGERDKKYVSISRKMANLLPGSELDIVPDCGHIVQFEQASHFTKAVAGFRKRIQQT